MYGRRHANGNADAMSHLPLPREPENLPVPGEEILMMEHMNSTPVTFRVHQTADEEGHSDGSSLEVDTTGLT